MANVRVFLLLCTFSISLATRSFWRGRILDEFHGDTLTLPPGKSLPEEQWFEQQTDPYSPIDLDTFQQRYFTNSEYFKAQDGPVFLLIGREGTANPRWMIEGAWLNYAKEFGALCIQLEQRFFGKSHPNIRSPSDNYVFSSSEIDVTDVAIFITEMKKKYNLTSKNRWIIFGGGYSGSLAAWTRIKFPHLAHGAVSSSGAVIGKLDFREYYDVVANSILDCRMSVKEAFSELENQLTTSPKHLEELFQLCDPIETPTDLDKSNLFDIMASIFASVVQSNGLPYAKHSVKEICSIMNDENKGSPLDRLAGINKIFLEEDDSKCLDYKYDNMIEQLKVNSWDAPAVVSGKLTWFFLLCKEFGYFQTSNNASYVFGNHFQLDFFLKQCSDVFGERFKQASIEKNIYNDDVIYGGFDIKSTNTIYIQGSEDPWHPLGLTESTDSGYQTVFIKGAAHCADMFEPRDDDLPELKAARGKIREYIAEVLNQSQ
ncbi:thymus-specific serine protease-like [Phlebotomus argentipes]|uniref:thymus-specific serine protease-like n=1 Tax=Phlebotomus argentipes TaxID=94469 RepID=UPI0028931F9E|nr:thymus-specific serine protease-like [Phlebotomus argentipes]